MTDPPTVHCYVSFHVIEYLLPHPIWSQDEVKSVEIKHTAPKGISDTLAYYAVQLMRKTFDLSSGYTIGKHLHTLDERSVLIRCIFLETVAGMSRNVGSVLEIHSIYSYSFTGNTIIHDYPTLYLQVFRGSPQRW